MKRRSSKNVLSIDVGISVKERICDESIVQTRGNVKRSFADLIFRIHICSLAKQASCLVQVVISYGLNQRIVQLLLSWTSSKKATKSAQTFRGFCFVREKG